MALEPPTNKNERYTPVNNLIHRTTHSLIAALSLAWSLIHGIGGGAGDWVPAKDEDLDAFCITFDTLITASPGTYALQASDATGFHTNRLAFTNALLLLNDPATNTKPNVEAKDAAKANLKTNLRTLAGLVQASPAVTNESRLALGLPVHTDTPAPIPPPGTFPLLAITKAGVLTHTLQYSDQDTPDSARKPAGAIGMELRVEVSATAIVDQEEIEYFGLATRNPVLIEYGADDKGKQAYICGRWINAKGEKGPWSLISNYTVAA